MTQLIARRVRESGIYCEIHPFNKGTAESPTAFGPKAIILSGGSSSVTEAGRPRAALVQAAELLQAASVSLNLSRNSGVSPFVRHPMTF